MNEEQVNKALTITINAVAQAAAYFSAPVPSSAADVARIRLEEVVSSISQEENNTCSKCGYPTTVRLVGKVYKGGVRGRLVRGTTTCTQCGNIETYRRSL